MDRAQLIDWIGRYERAWRSPGTDGLAELFTEDASYSTAPYENPHRGLAAIREMWEAERSGPDEDFEMSSEVVAAEGDTGVARVVVNYLTAKERRGGVTVSVGSTGISGSSGWTSPGSVRISRSGRSGLPIRREPRQPVHDACDNGAVDEVLIVRCGLVPYEEARRMQKRIEAARQTDRVPDVLLLLEHPPVYTKGRRTEPGELGMGEDWYRMQGIEVCETDRGGRVTYHGPGQLVGYPIVSLRPYGDNVHEYVRRLERLMIESLGAFGVAAEVIDGLTGVWVGGRPPEGRKIGSIGVHVNRGVTTHGFAVNVNNDLQPFEWVVPCGIEDCRMTSVCRELGAEQEMDDVHGHRRRALRGDLRARADPGRARGSGRAARRGRPGTVGAMATNRDRGPDSRHPLPGQPGRAHPGH